MNFRLFVRSQKLSIMDGIILINKEKDYTSHDVVAIAKKILGNKIGHTGTLDPNATGVLPLLIGKGTKLSKYLIEHDKTYTAVLKLGIKTDTSDITGNIIEKKQISDNTVSETQIKAVLNSFIGKQEQYPPMYSAIKVKGKKLYEYAREGKKVEVQPRIIEIYDIKLDKYNELEKEITFTVSCSKGTYIRTMCEDIAEKLGTIGSMKDLERLQVGRFKLEDAITIQQLKDNKDNKEFLNKNIITFEDIFKDKPKIIMEDKKLELFLNGVKIEKELENNIYMIYDNRNNFIGTGTIKNNLLKRDVIL